MGPGTKDEHLVPPAHRTAVTRKANLVIAADMVSGTWSLRGELLGVSWFPENGAAPVDALAEQIDRIATVTGRDLNLTLQVG